jgi:hypothetical protein
LIELIDSISPPFAAADVVVTVTLLVGTTIALFAERTLPWYVKLAGPLPSLPSVMI